ncbi:MAG TPA: peptide chain release factor N(5)-glutamine methyltransferase [Hyphomicrobium sp.]|jgi:release factor glutamine methyltransferase
MQADEQAYAGDQTVDAALKRMTRAFANAGLDSAQRDARFLLQGVLGIDGAVLLTQPERQLGALADRVGDAVQRRLAHEPVSRILGMREFYGRDFIVTPDVLDPRPDTEAVIELALEIVKSAGLEGKALEIADIGTGSGILIATLLAELPNARGVATDISPAALAVAKRNADQLGVGDRTTFVATRGLGGCAGPFDLIVSNPPYIATNDIKGLDPEVRGYDPLLALDGGPDGLSVYREFARDIVKVQRSTRLVVEVGASQAADVQGIFLDAGWHLLAHKRDLGGHVRAVALEIHP